MYIGRQSVDLTAPASPGTYYSGACVDAVSDESDTTNKLLDIGAGHGAAAARPENLADRRPEQHSCGESFTLLVTVRNDGDGESPATTIATSDTEVGTDDVDVLSASGTSEESISLTAPFSADTTNNCSSSTQVIVEERQPQVQGNPDLVVDPILLLYDPFGVVSSGGVVSGSSLQLQVKR